MRTSYDSALRLKETTLLSRLGKNLRRDRTLVIMAAPVILYILIFSYLPMWGVILAFRKYSPGGSFIGVEWVGFKYFETIFGSVYFLRLLINTFLISLFSLLWGFPIPILFALCLNEMRKGFFKRFTQTVSYVPYFISTVIVVSIMTQMFSRMGIINDFLEMLGLARVDFMVSTKWFRTLYVGSGIWQGFGWGSIIYLAALSGIDPQIYEAAKIDGAKRLQMMWRITLPCIRPTITILLILNCGSLLSAGGEKMLLMLTPATYEVGDVFFTYVYRRGLIGGEFGYGTALGLFNSVASFALLFTVNKISKKLSGISLW